MAEIAALQETAAVAASQAAAVADELLRHEDSEAEDYAWLTERLDALETGQREMLSQVAAVLERASNQSPSPEMTTAMQSLTEQNRLLTDQLTTMQNRQAELHTLVLSRLTPEPSTNSSQAGDSEPNPETPPESQPGSEEPELTPEQREERAKGRGRRRI